MYVFYSPRRLIEESSTLIHDNRKKQDTAMNTANLASS